MRSGTGTAESTLSSAAASWLVFFALLSAWILFHAIAAPSRATTDVFIFRDAGCNCAAGRGLSAASVPHGQTVAPRLFASYTPADPLLFAIAARAFGCSAYTDVFFNLFFDALAGGLLLYGILRGVTSPTVRLWSAFLIGMVIPTGLLSTDYDRPEAPAFCLLALLLLCWRADRSSWIKSVLMGLNGLVFLIHPFAGLIGWMVFCFLLIFANGQQFSLGPRCKVAGAGLALMLLPIGLCALVMVRLDPTSLHRFVEHAITLNAPVQGRLRSLRVGGGPAAAPTGQPQHQGYVAAFQRTFNSESLLAGLGMVSLVASFVAIAVFSAFSGAVDGKKRFWLQVVVLAFILLGIPVGLFPAQRNYFDLARLVLLLIAVLTGFELSDMLRKTRIPLLLIALSVVCLIPDFTISVLENIETRASYKQARDQAQRTAEYFTRHGKLNPAILVGASQYFLYKTHFQNLYSPTYLTFPGARKDYDGLVLCYTGTRAFSHQGLTWPEGLRKDGWELVENGENRLTITLLGTPVMRRNWTWACDLYALKSGAAR